MSGLGSGLDYADDGYGDCALDIFESERGGCVAGDDEEAGALFVEELCAGDGVASDGFVGLRAVRETCGVA